MGTHDSSFQEEAPRMGILRNGYGPPSVPWTPDLLVCLVSVRCRLSLNLYSRFSRGGGGRGHQLLPRTLYSWDGSGPPPFPVLVVVGLKFRGLWPVLPSCLESLGQP